MLENYECDGQMSLDDFLQEVNEEPKVSQDEADWWFIHNSTPVIHNGKATFRVDATGEIVDYNDRIDYVRQMRRRGCKGDE